MNCRWKTILNLAIALLLWTTLSFADNVPQGCWKDFYKRIVEKSKVLRGKATNELTPEAFRIFEKTRLNPAYWPNVSEVEMLRSQGVLHLFESYASAGKLVKDINHKLGILNRSTSKLTRKGLKRAWWGILELAIPVLPDVSKMKADRIFKKVINNPDYAFTAKEDAFLKKWKLLDKIESLRLDVRRDAAPYVTLSKMRTIGGYGAWTLALSAAGLGLLMNRDISTKESFDRDDEEGMSRYDDKVEIIYVSPMPHSSIRVGGIVYNYGVFHVDRYTLEDFRKMVGFGDSISGNHTRVELKLTDDQRHRLRDYLEADVGKVYPLVFPFNDCISQTNKAIKETCDIDVPSIADRSQSGSIAYFKMLKLLGDERIGDIHFASKDNEYASEKAKDAVVNVIDGLFFMKHAGKVFVATPIIDNVQSTFDMPAPRPQSK